ncbi:unnamed protein product, partial [Medioppia subpectinata]
MHFLSKLALNSSVSSKVQYLRYFSSNVRTTKLFINGQFVESKTNEWIDLKNPATNELVTRVPKSTDAEMEAAVSAADNAFKTWSKTSVLTRQQTMFKLQALIKQNLKRLTDSITEEQGKTTIDAEGDVFRGLQVVEHACSVTSLLLGETMPSIAKDMDSYSLRLPLGATNELVTRVPKSTDAEMEAAVSAADNAFKTWSKTSVLTRQQTMFKLQALIKQNMKRLTDSITEEQGKTTIDAEGDVFRGLQVVEHACSVTSLLLGETMPSIAKDMDSYSLRLPLGVCAGITPFNFPAMIPLWMFPIALVSGNTYVLKPSERDPGAAMIFMEMLEEAGVPPGVVNVIHGQHKAVDFICDHPKIQAISFVGSDTAGKYIYARGSANGKRVQSNMGAKNHGVIMPDANKDHALNQLAGAAFGAAGQRCMALSTAVFVGETKEWINDLVEKAKKLKVNAGHIP